MKRYFLLALLAAAAPLLQGAKLAPPAGYKRLSPEQSHKIIFTDDFSKGTKNWKFQGPRTIYSDPTGGTNGGAGVYYDRTAKNVRRSSTLVKKFTLIPGKTYRATVDFKIDNAFLGDPKDKKKILRVHTLYVDNMNGKKYVRGRYPRFNVYPGKSGKWQKAVAEFLVPPTATHTNISLGMYPQGYKLGMTGKVAFDNFQLELLGDPPAPIYPIRPKQLSLNDDGVMVFRIFDQMNRSDKNLKLRVVFGKKDIIVPVKNKAAKFNTGKLPYGKHKFKLQLLDTERKIVSDETEYDFTYNKPGAGNFPGSTKVGADGIVYVNGKPYFPIQMAVSPRRLDKETILRMKEAGIDLIHPYSSITMNVEKLPGPPSLEKIRKSLDFVHAQNMKVIMCVKEQINGEVRNFEGIKDRVKIVELVVKKLHRHPAILAWYIADENPLGDMHKIIELRKVISAADPFHPVVVCTDKAGDHLHFGPAADIMEPDCYPIREKHTQSMKAIRKHMATDIRLPKWFFVQAFNWGVYWEPREKYRQPSAEEIRSMAFLAVNCGAKCISFYSYGSVRLAMERLKYPRETIEKVWQDVVHAIRATGELGGFVISKDKAPAVKVENKAKSFVQAKAYKKGKQICVAITGDGPGKADALIRVPAGINFKSKYGKTVKVSDGVYRFTGMNICSDLLTNY